MAKTIPTKEELLAVYKRDPYFDRYYQTRNEMIKSDYVSGETTTEKIAEKYHMSPRTVQRNMKSLGVVRSIAESNKLMAKYKNYDALRLPEELKAKRKTLPKNLRYKMLREHPYCKTCGSTPLECPLQVDHIDGDATNNNLSNLQVLCMRCNYGKK